MPARERATSSSHGPRSSCEGWSKVTFLRLTPRLLTRAVLGLYNSIWHWYRPRGTMGLDEVADFFIRRQLAVLVLDPAVADRPTVPR